MYQRLMPLLFQGLRWHPIPRLQVSVEYNLCAQLCAKVQVHKRRKSVPAFRVWLTRWEAERGGVGTKPAVKGSPGVHSLERERWTKEVEAVSCVQTEGTCLWGHKKGSSGGHAGWEGLVRSSFGKRLQTSPRTAHRELPCRQPCGS